MTDHGKTHATTSTTFYAVISDKVFCITEASIINDIAFSSMMMMMMKRTMTRTVHLTLQGSYQVYISSAISDMGFGMNMISSK